MMQRTTGLALAAMVAVALTVTLTLAFGAQAPAAESFFFLQFSDPQFGMFTADKDFPQETANFELAIATVNRWRPAFLVITGDLVNNAGDSAQVAEYRPHHGAARSRDSALQHRRQSRRRQRADAGVGRGLHRVVRPRLLFIQAQDARASSWIRA